MRSRLRRASVCWIPGLLLTIAAAAPAQEALVLHVLDCGTMSGIETQAFLPGVEDRPKRFDMVNRCFLVVHPQGTLLWDVGFPDSVSFRFQTFLLWLTTFGRSSVGVDRSLVDQLADLGVAPADVDYLALSHSHFDHVGEANAFAASTWLVQQKERAWAFRDDLDHEFVQPELYAALADAKTRELEGDHDVFGDGSVEILSSPGHTPGHQCLYLELPRAGPVILSGDLYHSTLSRELRVAPEFNTDEDETRRSMQRIEKIAAERGAELWIQHAPDSGPTAPAQVE